MLCVILHFVLRLARPLHIVSCVVRGVLYENGFSLQKGFDMGASVSKSKSKGKSKSAVVVVAVTEQVPAVLPAPEAAPAAQALPAKQQWTAELLAHVLQKHAQEEAHGVGGLRNGISLVTRDGYEWRIVRSWREPDGALRFEGVKVKTGQRLPFGESTAKQLLRNCARVLIRD